MYYFSYYQAGKIQELPVKDVVNYVLKAKVKWSLNCICINILLDAASSWMFSSSSKREFLYPLCCKLHSALYLKRKFSVDIHNVGATKMNQMKTLLAG